MPKTITIRMPESEMIRFRRWTNQISEQTKAKLKNRIQAAAERMRKMALLRVRVDKGFLRRGIHAQVTKEGYGVHFYNAVNYAPYMEFGTGKYVNVPSGLEDVAMSFKGRGIRRVNIYPKPFFYGSFDKALTLFKQDLKKLGFEEKK